MWKIQKKIQTMMKARGWDKTAPADQAKSIMIEGAELLEHFQWKNFTVAEIKKDKEKIKNLKERVEFANNFVYDESNYADDN